MLLKHFKQVRLEGKTTGYSEAANISFCGDSLELKFAELELKLLVVAVVVVSLTAGNWKKSLAPNEKE